MSDEISLEMAWSPVVLKEVSRLNMTAENSPDAKRHRRTIVLLIVTITAILILLFGPIQSGLPYPFLWFALGLLAMRAVVTFIHIPAMNRRRIARAMSSPLSQGTFLLTLSGTGIIVEQAVSYTAYDWNAVMRVQEEALALHLMVGHTLSVPIPDAALPEGIDRAEVRERIEAWRAAAAVR